MSALARPGPQFGAAGPPPPGSPEHQQSFSAWFWLFLKQELAPYPGRATIVARMVIAATLTMWMIMTFRLPGAAVAAFYTLLLSRDSPRTTLKSAAVVLAAYIIGATYTLLSIMLLVDYPITHFLLVIFSIFLCFFAIKVTTNYVASAAFAFILTIAIPIWDASAPTGLLVIATLWTAGSVTVGLFSTVAVEYAFSLFETEDELVSGLCERLGLLSRCLAQRATNKVNEETEKKLYQLTMVGVSRLRRLAADASSRFSENARQSGTIALVGRLVDLSATLLRLEYTYSGSETQRMREVSDRLALIAAAIRSGRVEQPKTAGNNHPPGPPMLFELERTTDLLSVSLFARPGEAQPSGSAPLSDEKTIPAAPTTFLPDALTNPEHLFYALRGCLAASLCYIIFNAVAWRGLSTSLATCVITGLSSIGSSRQKQLLRISGAIVGGLVLGIGAQVYVLPALDTLTGFTVLFVGVTLISAWFATASPRLSYFGLQVALAFYLINLQEFVPQTNLAIARDRVLGIALGLAAMGLVFDVLGSKPAIQVMRDIFATNLRLLAELAQPWKNNQPADIQKLRALRDTISTNFSSVNSQADAVLFETGSSRASDLAVRERLLRWQPQLRSIFLIQISLLQYRAGRAPGELDANVLQMQTEYDHRVATALTALADCFSKGPAAAPSSPHQVQAAYTALESAVEKQHETIRPQAQAVLVLSSSLTQVLNDLAHEMQAEG